jgi:hypothetical protein
MTQRVLQNLLIALLLSSGLFSFGQKYSNPDYYLNSKKVQIENLYLNPWSIDSISVNKKTENGEIYIFTKTRKVNFLSLEDVLKKYTNLSSSSNSVLFRINGNILDDLSNIRIDDSYFIYVETRKLSETQYLAKKFRELVIVEISLEKEERKQVIMIRGNSSILSTEIEDLMNK